MQANSSSLSRSVRTLPNLTISLSGSDTTSVATGITRNGGGRNTDTYLSGPDYIAHLVVFLTSDAARHNTDQALATDGGTSIHIPGYARLNRFFSAISGIDFTDEKLNFLNILNASH